MKALTIGKVAKETGVGVETIRFYEREKLIESPPRIESGYRQFPPETVKRIRFIRRAKVLGFTLKEIRGLLALETKPGQSCSKVQSQAQKKIADIDQKIASLQRMKAALSRLVRSCKNNVDSGRCPILDSLEGETS
ncbi:MAG: heavy metal-responsive transcriptional regulator [Acidobacteria bacterium]|nr:MAG: heavy metal-responsive transcriptional regulator [Acidobacteriota bacterium]RLE21776.1 MAG: heavy metal-responsive transcriptional regulator [Acidobacteriota bacterium]